MVMQDFCCNRCCAGLLFFLYAHAMIVQEVRCRVVNAYCSDSLRKDI